MDRPPTVLPTALEIQVKARPLPRHVGIIMDGNGRWAELRGQPRLEGHREGSVSVREVTRAARRVGVQALTLYAFSSQNWARPPEEVAGLMELLREYLESERAEILDNGIRLNAIGEVDKLPRYVREPLERLRADSAHNTGMVLTLALSYGGREELLRAARDLAQAAARGELDPAHLDAEDLESRLWTAGLPPVDLIVRTSGEQRISNFLLWQLAYAELCFTDALWPDFRTEEFLRCLSQFQGRERRFGLTSAQVNRDDTPQRAKA
ncbi:di-trans,poly-cis-decaprenylcistransferase [Corallococcus sp. AB004]|uniref:polyprenyl diphosphate synthase n=1 Tax=Corallococcus sp. AB038B TaxID=2316718 RepID=UPI000EA239AE|nr:polyprenyl diphosphate synthase [Corallococcus sp. AB038B]RKI00529.1 di-trans,poly-cis-decaprenylcistransferase [Corallococcus sp. AB038B]RKI29206.1 di-trans,poly-cis-decaprenylcistransferase [Corallococcus sp. AB004]